VSCPKDKVLINTILEGRIRHDNKIMIRNKTECRSPREGEACPTHTPLQNTTARLTFSVKTNQPLTESTEYGAYSLENDFTLTLERNGNTAEYTVPVKSREGRYSGEVQVNISGGTYAVTIKHLNSNRVVFNGLELNKGDVLDCTSADNASCGDLQKWRSDEKTLVLGDVNRDSRFDDTDKDIIMSHYLEIVENTDTNAYAADLNKDGTVDGADLALFMRGSRIVNNQ
jgi:hypothetical protein